MTFNPGRRGDYHTLVRIELDGVTLYYADANLSMSDGNYYEGRLKVSALRRAFASITEPKQRRSTLTITLHDPDLTVRSLLTEHVWGFREVTVLVGKGRNLDDYITDFRGVIAFPGGISYDRETVSVRLGDVRDRDTATIPPDRFLTSLWPNLQSGMDGTPIPLVYGDYSDTAVPAVCVDTTTNTFKIAGHPIDEIVQVFVNDSPVSHTDESLSTASFRLVSYDPANDEVTASIKGKIDSAGNLIENPALIVKDMLTEFIGVSASAIDTAAFDELAGDLFRYRARRYLADEESSETLICELGIEALFDVFINNDKYTAKSRVPRLNVDNVFDETVVSPDSFSVETDPEDLYSNRIICHYDKNPADDEYRLFYQDDNVVEQLRLGRVVGRTIESRWLWLEDNIITTVQRYMLLYSHEINMITFTSLGKGVLAQLSDHAALSFANFNERPLIVRETSKNFNTMTCEISGYDEATYTLPGFWCADTAPEYTSASPEQRATQGFWTDDEGCAETGNPNSELSHWW